MNKYIFPLIIVGVLSFIIYTKLNTPNRIKGKVAPNFSATLIDGTAFELGDLAGQYVVLDFWGSWCPPCRRDNPNLVQLHNQFNGKSYSDASGFEIVTIALEKNDKRWRKAAQKDGFVWKTQIVREARYVMTDGIALKYNVTDLPTKIFISPNTEVIGVNWSKEQIEDYMTAKML